MLVFLSASLTHSAEISSDPLQFVAQLVDEGSMPRRAVQKGERHSGNNFLQEMLNKNFEQNPEGGGCDTSSAVSARHFCCWTHGMASDECAAAFTPPPSVYVLLVRNPYAWLLAMNSEPYEYDGWKSGRLSNFLRAPFSYAPYPMYAGAQHHRHDNPVKLWSAKVAAYLALRTPKVMLRHEELYEEAKVRAKLELLTTRHGIARRPGLSAVVYPNFTSAGNNNHNREFTRAEFDTARAFEREQRWVSSYSQADLDFVNSQLDPAQARAAPCLVAQTRSPPPHPPYHRNPTCTGGPRTSSGPPTDAPCHAAPSQMEALGFEMLTRVPAPSSTEVVAAKASAAAGTAAAAAARRVAALYAANHTDTSHDVNAKPHGRSLMPRGRTSSTLSLLESKVDATYDSLLNFMDRAWV